MSRRYDEYIVEYLTDEDLGNLAFLKSLPRHLPTKLIVNLFKSLNPIRDLKGEFVYLLYMFLYWLKLVDLCVCLF